MSSTLLNGKYSVDLNNPVGEGATSKIYQGKEVMNGRQVAIKLVDLRKINKRILVDEMALVSSLSHPNIIRYFDAFEVEINGEAHYAFIMEYFRNGSLLDYFYKIKHIDQLDIVVQGVLAGLSYLADIGIAHRDIKPGNILINDKGEPLIADFSAALELSRLKVLNPEADALNRLYELNQNNDSTGNFSHSTPDYLSPEQFNFQVSLKSDVWSLGMTLYHLFTRSLPYKNDITPEKMIEQYGLSYCFDSYIKQLETIHFESLIQNEIPEGYKQYTDLLLVSLMKEAANRLSASELVQNSFRPTPKLHYSSITGGLFSQMLDKLFSRKARQVHSIQPGLPTIVGIRTNYIHTYNQSGTIDDRRTILVSRETLFYARESHSQLNSKSNRCINCGYNNPNNANKCLMCGYILQNFTYYNFLIPSFDSSSIHAVMHSIQNLRERDAINHLDSLDLSHLKLAEIDQELVNLPALKVLKVLFYEQDGKSYPSGISQLQNLEILDISESTISKLPEELFQLKNLKQLIISGMENLYELDKSLCEMPRLEEVIAENTPLVSPPPEILYKGMDAVRNYFEELLIEGEEDYLNEIKLIIVGEGRVGKSSLMKRLCHSNFYFNQYEQSTEGIEIQKWMVPKEDIGLSRDFRINIWDFGGQEIYHSTHQFFLTKRSVYLLITEPRKEDKHDDFYYWLNIIKLLGGDSPVILVQNKIDLFLKELPYKEYAKFFPNLLAYHRVSCVGTHASTINVLKDEIFRIIKDKDLLPHIGTPLPKVWIDIRREMEIIKLKKIDYIALDEFIEICGKYGLDEQRAMYLCSFFHDLGVLLHFNDDLILSKYIIVNHEWVTEAVYRILDDRNIILKKGQFNHNDLAQIWQDGRFRNMRGELLALMRNPKFDLCFELENKEYLVPQLLPVDEVEFEWDEQSSGSLRFEYSYEFMPKGILARFIVKSHRDIFKNTFWRYGVMLEYNGAKALVRENYFDRKVSITVTGENRKELLSIIRKNINEINFSFNNLKVFEKLPCNCESCKSANEPYFYAFSDLIKRKSKGVKTIECNNSFEQINIDALLEGVSTRVQIDESKINELIRNGKTQEALNELETFLIYLKSKETLNDVILLKSQYSNLSKEYYTNRTIDHDRFTRELNKVNMAILEIVRQFVRPV